MGSSLASAERTFFTSESVSEGHPDKVCDQISDAVLDAILTEDPQARVACETSTTTGIIFVFGEITTTAYVDIQKIVRETLREIGQMLFLALVAGHAIGLVVDHDLDLRHVGYPFAWVTGRGRRGSSP